MTRGSIIAQSLPQGAAVSGMSHRLILASGSRIRATLLRNAGVGFEPVPARVDEIGVTASLVAEGVPGRDIADALAELKARKVALANPDALVIGTDQVLVCDGKPFGKAGSSAEVRKHLKMLRGRPHELFSAAVAFEDARPVWRSIGRVRLQMRSFSDDFLHAYIARHGDDLRETVGCYKLEEDGVQLFSSVDGDYFSVLGLPLLELLAFLRTRGIVPA